MILIYNYFWKKSSKKSVSPPLLQLLKNYYAVIEAIEKEKSNNTLKGDLIKNILKDKFEN